MQCVALCKITDAGDKLSTCDTLFRNRGTECMRSPEMLLATSCPGTPTSAHSGGCQHTASDVWALGCLLFELVTGSVLFPNELDWPKFFITVTDPSQVPTVPKEAVNTIFQSGQCSGNRCVMHQLCPVPQESFLALKAHLMSCLCSLLLSVTNLTMPLVCFAAAALYDNCSVLSCRFCCLQQLQKVCSQYQL